VNLPTSARLRSAAVAPRRGLDASSLSRTSDQRYLPAAIASEDGAVLDFARTGRHSNCDVIILSLDTTRMDRGGDLTAVVAYGGVTRRRAIHLDPDRAIAEPASVSMKSRAALPFQN